MQGLLFGGSQTKIISLEQINKEKNLVINSDWSLHQPPSPSVWCSFSGVFLQKVEMGNVSFYRLPSSLPKVYNAWKQLLKARSVQSWCKKIRHIIKKWIILNYCSQSLYIMTAFMAQCWQMKRISCRPTEYIHRINYWTAWRGEQFLQMKQAHFNRVYSKVISNLWHFISTSICLPLGLH